MVGFWFQYFHFILIIFLTIYQIIVQWCIARPIPPYPNLSLHTWIALSWDELPASHRGEEGTVSEPLQYIKSWLLFCVKVPYLFPVWSHLVFRCLSWHYVMIMPYIISCDRTDRFVVLNLRNIAVGWEPPAWAQSKPFHTESGASASWLCLDRMISYLSMHHSTKARPNHIHSGGKVVKLECINFFIIYGLLMVTFHWVGVDGGWRTWNMHM